MAAAAALIWAALAVSGVHAAPGETISWVVERPGLQGLEQNALYLENGRIRVTKNSNFLEIDDGPGSQGDPIDAQVALGLFELPSDAPGAEQIAVEMRALTRRLPLPKPGSRKPISSAPHAVRVWINGVLAPSSMQGLPAVIELVRSAVENPKLRLLHGVKLLRKGPGKLEAWLHEGSPPKDQPLRLEPGDCRPSDVKRVVCTVKRFGHVYVLR